MSRLIAQVQSLGSVGACGRSHSILWRSGLRYSAYGIVIDANGNATDIVKGDAGIQLPDSVRDCYLEALAGHRFPCLAGDTVINQCVIVCLF